MIDPVRERAAPVSPQMALRVAALGVGALVMFAIVFFRLWYLEVLSGDKYRQEANNNKVRRLLAHETDLVVVRLRAVLVA